MRKLIVDFIVVLATFVIGNTYFHQYINFNNTESLFIATLLMFILNIVLDVLMVVSVGLIPFGVGCLGVILVGIASMIATPLKLLVIDMSLVDFSLHGFWTYVVLTIIFSLLGVGKSYDREKDRFS